MDGDSASKHRDEKNRHTFTLDSSILRVCTVTGQYWSTVTLKQAGLPVAPSSGTRYISEVDRTTSSTKMCIDVWCTPYSVKQRQQLCE